jgi:predicted AlkP superfamily pyrophosphatase or phosphodiesterase
MRKLVATAGLVLVLGPVAGVYAQAYRAKPKLVIELVIDQFRGDYLDRYRDDFKTANGFNLFLNKGAYFTDCYYQYANTMTAPGHSTIGTGAYTNGHGISLNEWWDFKRSTTHPVSSVEDERYDIVGDHGPSDVGASPRNELASTLGDEVVLASAGKSKVFGISLKDRAAILTSGHASSGAFWLDHASGHFVSSTYWGAKLPDWAEGFNGSGRAEKAAEEAKSRPGHFYDDVGASPASVSYLLDFAETLIASEKLGQHETTDVLTISISSTDILGHQVGPDSPKQRAMIDAIDVDLDRFFTWLGSNVDGGLGNVWMSLTGDHGIGPTIDGAAASGMPAAIFNLKKVSAALDEGLNAKFSPGKGVKYILQSEVPYITLDPRAFAAGNVSEADAENAVADLLPGAFASTALPEPAGPVKLPTRALVRHAYTKVQMASGELPNTEDGRRILQSYSPNGEWYVLFTPGMYMQGAATGTNHYTPYSYDRHVPLAFYGSAFVPGTYHGLVEPVDIAATFASLLRVNRPSAAVGRVLVEAITPMR